MFLEALKMQLVNHAQKLSPKNRISFAQSRKVILEFLYFFLEKTSPQNIPLDTKNANLSTTPKKVSLKGRKCSTSMSEKFLLRVQQRFFQKKNLSLQMVL